MFNNNVVNGNFAAKKLDFSLSHVERVESSILLILWIHVFFRMSFSPTLISHKIFVLPEH